MMSLEPMREPMGSPMPEPVPATIMDYSGKVGLVTGAGMGIGRASAIAFAGRGASVAVVDIDPEAAAETVHLIEAGGGRAISIVADVSAEADIAAAVEKTATAFGRLDFAHNNAGIMAGNGLIETIAEADWSRAIQINLTGVFLSMKYELPRLVAQGGGAIVNTASVAGLAPERLMPAYVASKHGVVGLTQTAALDYADAGVRINAICPGSTRTPMFTNFAQDNPGLEQQRAAAAWLGRVGTPDEIAAAAIWLCSDEASFVTGIALRVDGGRR
jgi:NAD(P)-dependent dehydrogenase (short-subunit alcohol dehydrogenase family)